MQINNLCSLIAGQTCPRSRGTTAHLRVESVPIIAWNRCPSSRGTRKDPFAGHLFVFRGRRGDLIKIIWWDGQGACMFMKRLEKGRFVWPSAKDGKIALTPAQLAMLLEGIDWRLPQRTWRPLTAG